MELLVILIVGVIGCCSSCLALEGRTASLARSNWVKLIAGASNNDIPLIRNLCYVYASVGVDCIDCSADPAVVLAAQEAIDAGTRDYGHCHLANNRPLLMISVNDDEDPHFRKAKFDPHRCPSDCPRPCEKICPAAAIPSLVQLSEPSIRLNENGVLRERCYGCGRCVPVCPLGLVETDSYVTDRAVIRDLFKPANAPNQKVDAIEIHTHQGNEQHFAALWHEIGASVLHSAEVIAVSFPDMGPDTVPYLNSLMDIMRLTDENAYNKFESRHGSAHVWQTDGRPMSGDIGKGTAHAACEFAARMLRNLNEDINSSRKGRGRIDLNSGKHYLQLAGGTNAYSVVTARANELHEQAGFGGYAFGGYARKLLREHLLALEEIHHGAHIEDSEHAEVLGRCRSLALELVGSVKGT